MTKQDYISRTPNRYNMRNRLGFWEFCAVAVVAGAAVKITKELTKDCQDIDIPDEKITKAVTDERPCDYVVLKEKSFRRIAKARVKVMELMDLYGCCTEAEIRDVMGYEVDYDDLDRKVFMASTKFKVKYVKGEYVLYAQAPDEVFEEAENGKYSGDENGIEEGIPGQGVEEKS